VPWKIEENRGGMGARMFTQLRVKNYKAWKGEHQVELAPLSLFLGTNSAGKTSLLQMLLLLKQTVESPDRRQHLSLGGQPSDVLHLGGFRDIISGHDLRSELAFGVRFTDFPSPSKRQRPIEYDVSYCQATGGVPVVKSLTYAAGGRTFKAERQRSGSYLLVAGESMDSGQITGAEPRPARRYEPERSVAFSAAAVVDLGLEGVKVQDLALQMVQALKETVYLGPLRERPQRIYPWNQQSPGDLGRKGEFAIQALLASANARAKRTDTGGKGWLVERVSHWLQVMDVAEDLSLEQQGASIHYEVIVVQGKTKANLVDVGFGVSQVLPVVTLAYFVPEGSTVILEQPEIHLHPLAQTALADLFVEASQTRRVQFLIETHSEHLFRRLQFLLADEQISPEECRLYFVKKGEEGATLQKLEVDEYGRIKNWPEKFFGDAIGEVERQTRRMIERMAKRQGS
jgi:predicted ATPase